MLEKSTQQTYYTNKHSKCSCTRSQLPYKFVAVRLQRSHEEMGHNLVKRRQSLLARTFSARAMLKIKSTNPMIYTIYTDGQIWPFFFTFFLCWNDAQNANRHGCHGPLCMKSWSCAELSAIWCWSAWFAKYSTHSRQLHSTVRRLSRVFVDIFRFTC